MHSKIESLQFQLNRLVRSQDDIICELQDKIFKTSLLVQGVPVSFKVRLTDKEAPLKIRVIHEEKHSKMVQAFMSYINKEPSEKSNSGSFMNPTLITI